MDERTTPSSLPPVETPKKSSFVGETLRFIILSLLIVLPIRLFIAQPFVVSGASMDPTFDDGEYLIVDELSYRFDEPKRGDVIIFRYPRNTSKFFIKRVLALPNESLEIRGGDVYVKTTGTNSFEKIEEKYVYPGNTKIDESLSVTLKENEYFVMGDNRKESSDSRAWGPLHRKYIVGTPFVRLFPLSNFDFFPGGTSQQLK